MHARTHEINLRVSSVSSVNSVAKDISLAPCAGLESRDGRTAQETLVPLPALDGPDSDRDRGVGDGVLAELR